MAKNRMYLDVLGILAVMSLVMLMNVALPSQPAWLIVKGALGFVIGFFGMRFWLRGSWYKG